MSKPPQDPEREWLNDSPHITEIQDRVDQKLILLEQRLERQLERLQALQRHLERQAQSLNPLHRIRLRLWKWWLGWKFRLYGRRGL
jgi:hypothetical protein